MPKKPTNGAVAAAELSPEEKSELEVMQQFVDLGPNVKVHVYRMPGRNHLGNIVPAEMDPEVIYERYGGGEFVFRAQKNGQWATGIPQASMNIEGKPKVRDAEEPNGATNEFDKLRLEVMELQKSDEPRNGMDLAVSMMGMMSTVMSAVLTSSLERKPEMTALEVLQIGRELAKDQIDATASGGGGGEDALITHGLIPLVHEIGRLGKGEESNPPAERTLPAPTPRAPETTQELIEFVAKWCEPHCAIGANPSLRAELFLEDLELRNGPLRAAVIELASVPNVLDLWASFAPSVAADKEWHADFIEAIQHFGPTDEGLDDPERGPGDASDVAGDVEALEEGVAE